MNKQILFVAVCAVGLGTFAAEIPWSDGVKGGTLSFGADKSGDNSLTLPQRHYKTQVTQLSFAAGSGGTLTVNGGEEDYSFGMAENNQEYAYSEYPFLINGAVGSLFSIHRQTLAGVLPATDEQPQIEITNAAFRVIRDGTQSTLHIDGGVWNAAAPYGVSIANTVRLGSGYGDDQLENRIYVHEGATLELPYLCFDACARDSNLLCIDGGQHHIRKRICFPGASLPDAYKTLDRTVQMIVTGPDTVVESDMSFSPLSGQRGSGDVLNQENTDVQVIVTNGASLRVTGELHPVNQAKRFLMRAVDHAQVQISGAGYLGQDFALPCSIQVEEGASFYLGGLHLGYLAAGTFAVTNAVASLGDFWGWNGSVLSSQNASLTNANVVGASCHIQMEGGDWTLTGAAGVQLGADSSLKIDGCEVWTAGGFGVGTDATASVVAVVTNAATVYAKNGFRLGTDASASGQLDIADNSIVTAYAEPLEIATGSGSVGTLNLRSGSIFRHEAGTSNTTITVVGKTGTGTLLIDNASFTNHISHVKVADEAGSVGSLILKNGAFMQANYICGGSGTSTLQADGATFMPTVASGAVSVSTDLIHDLSSARLGADGLTIDSPKNVTISQVFGNDGVAKGLLVLDGDGQKTLTGANTHSITRIASGSAVLATCASCVDVAQGATLSLANNSADAVTYGGLVLGDANGPGILAVDAADVITTTAAPTFNGVYLALNGTPANGTYPLVKTSATVASAVKTAWTGSYLYAGRQSGKMYAFTVTEVSGVTSFNLIVSDARALDANQIKNYNGAGGTVTVSGVQSVDAVVFNSSSGYTISGSGSFKINDSGAGYVKALTGAHELGIGLILPGVTVFDVAEGAELEVSGNITNGGVRKTGFGKLTLSGSNSFLDDLTHEKGILRLEGVAADGYNEAGRSNDFILKRGTFEFEGDSAGETLRRSLIADGGLHTAVVANVKTPLTVKSYAAKSGMFIKRGAGTLTYDLTTNTTVNCENGRAAWTGVGASLSFPANGDMPTAGYVEGYNVAEGDVVFQGPTNCTASMKYYSRVGLNTPDGTVDPSLTFKGLYVDSTGTDLQMGLIDKTAFARHFSLTLSEGACMRVYGLYMKGLDDESGLGSTVCDLTIADNGWLIVYWYLNLAANDYAQVNIRQLNGGSLYVPSSPVVTFQSPFTWTIDGGRFALHKTNQYQPSDDAASVQFAYQAKGEVTLKNADFRCSSSLPRLTKSGYTINYSTNAIAFHFDGTTWYPKAANINLAVYEAETFTFDVTGNGLIISNDAAKAFTVHRSFTGDGKIVKAGEGTLSFCTNISIHGSTVSKAKTLTTNVLDRTYTMDVTGRLEVRQGTVYVDSGTIRPDAVVTVAEGAVLDLSGTTVEVEAIGGRGTVRNGTLKVKQILADDADLKFVNASLPLDGVHLDFERTSENPLDLRESYVLAHLPSQISGTYSPRVYGTGYSGNFRGNMTCDEDGNVTVSNILQHGFHLIVR